MSYNWRKALINSALVFIGCILAKIPAGDTMVVSWHDLKHMLITCGTITLFAELRYIYAWLMTIGGELPPPSKPTIPTPLAVLLLIGFSISYMWR